MDEAMDPRAADRLYAAFPAFSEWAEAIVSADRWARFEARMADVRAASSPEAHRAALSFVRRAAAIDTGALEKLYAVDRGFTFTVAAQSDLWQEALRDRGPRTERLIHGQIAAYDDLLDFVTGKKPVVEAWIRELHAQLCRAQEKYQVHVGDRIEERDLPLGRYKDSPNHVRKADGSVHPYAPVEMVQPEMHRLIEELGSEEFASAHPVLQAAFAHYAFVWIHPFADGNGRVARAMASVFTMRALSIPLVVLADQRTAYFTALEQADDGNRQAFVDFVFDRCLEAVGLIRESFAATQSSDSAREFERLRDLQRTKSGLTFPETDAASIRFVEALADALNEVKHRLGTTPEAWFEIRPSPGATRHEPGPGLRHPVEPGPFILDFRLVTPAPAEASVVAEWQVHVPREADLDDLVVLYESEFGLTIEARLADLLPTPSAALKLQLRMFADRAVVTLLREGHRLGAESLKQRGYIQGE